MKYFFIFCSIIFLLSPTVEAEAQKKGKRKYNSSKKMARMAKKRNGSNSRGNKKAQKLYAKARKERIRQYEGGLQKEAPAIIAENKSENSNSKPSSAAGSQSVTVNSGSQAALIAQLRAENSQLRSDLATSNSELSKIKNQYDPGVEAELETEITRLNAELAGNKAELSSLKNQSELLSEDALRSEVATLRAELASNQSELTSYRNQQESTSEVELIAQVTRLQSELVDSQSQLATLNDQGVSEQEMTRLKDELEGTKFELAKLKLELDPTEKQNLMAENAVLVKDNRLLNDKLYSQAREVKRLRDQVEEIKLGQRELVLTVGNEEDAMLENENDELVFHLKEMEAELKSSKSDLAQLQKLNNDLIANSGKLGKEVSQELDRLREDNVEKDREIVRLNEQLSLMKNQEQTVLASYGDNSSSLLEVIENLKSDIYKKNSQIDDLQNDVSSMEQLKVQLDQPMSSFNLSPINGIVFRIQIGAYGKKDLSRFSDVDPENFKIENVDGVQRYFVGYFDDYWKADDFKGQLRQLGVGDAFVAAFKDGKRIPMRQYIDQFRASR